jgi:hypothetical protein
LGNYGDYLIWPFQVSGVSFVAVALVIVSAGLANASLFEGLIKSNKDTGEKDLEMTEHYDFAVYDTAVC